MHFCYLDESGNSDLRSNTDHFVYLGIAIPAVSWRSKDAAINKLKSKYNLSDAEVHTAWMIKKYPEQVSIPNFDSLDYATRRVEVLKRRDVNLSKWVIGKTDKQLKDKKKDYKKTSSYIHLTLEERKSFLLELAELIGSWSDARVFFEAIKKPKYDIAKAKYGIYESAFQQVVTRFETFLVKTSFGEGKDRLGILVSDNNESENRKLTNLMREFHKEGTVWRDIKNIVETPFFVDSQLTSMVQVADLAAYAVRRFFEKNERELFDKISPRFDRHYARLVGVRHYTPEEACSCDICKKHK